MKRSLILSMIVFLVSGFAFAQNLVVDEPFNSGGLAYSWDDLRSVDDYLPKIMADSTFGITDQDSDGVVGAMEQPDGSTINVYYVPGVTDVIQDGKIEAWIYVQQDSSTTSTVYAGVEGRGEYLIDPVAQYMYRTIWRTNTTTIRCQSYTSTAGWHTIANTDVITTEGWHLITMNIQNPTGPPQVDAWDGTIHFASELDSSTIQSDLGQIWGIYGYTALDDWVFCDDVKIYNYYATKVEDWHLF